MGGIKGRYQRTTATQNQEIEVLRRSNLKHDASAIAEDLGLRLLTVDAIISRGVVSRLRVPSSATVRCRECGAKLTAFPCFGCEAESRRKAKKLALRKPC